MSDKLVISIDSSTTACKAIAWDRTGNAVAEGRASYPMLQPQPTWGEQDAEDWWRSVCTALRECVAQVDASKVEALVTDEYIKYANAQLGPLPKMPESSDPGCR